MTEFKVGGKVVAIEDHRQGIFKKGEIFELLGIQKSSCKCDFLSLDIGISKTKKTQSCYACGGIWKNKTNAWWVSSLLFVPIEDFRQITYTKILETIPIGVQ